MLNTFSTTIYHPIRKHLGISESEWCFLDTIFKLQANPKGKHPGWCDARKEDLAKDRSVSRQGISKMIDKLERLDLLEKSPKSHLKTTSKWYFETVVNKDKTMDLSKDVNFVDNSIRKLNVNLVDTECKLSLHDDVNLVDTECKLSLQSKESKNKRRIETLKNNEHPEIFQISVDAEKENLKLSVEAEKTGHSVASIGPGIEHNNFGPTLPTFAQQAEKMLVDEFQKMGAVFVDVTPAKKEKPKAATDKKAFAEKVPKVVKWMNEKLGRDFKADTPDTVNKITTLLRRGYVFQDFEDVLTDKKAEWENTEWEKFLRPSTLFQETKFEGYLEAARAKKKKAEIPAAIIPKTSAPHLQPQTEFNPYKNLPTYR